MTAREDARVDVPHIENPDIESPPNGQEVGGCAGPGTPTLAMRKESVATGRK